MNTDLTSDEIDYLIQLLNVCAKRGCFEIAEYNDVAFIHERLKLHSETLKNPMPDPKNCIECPDDEEDEDGPTIA